MENCSMQNYSNYYYTTLSCTYIIVLCLLFSLDLIYVLFSCTSCIYDYVANCKMCELGIEIGVEDTGIFRFYIITAIKEKLDGINIKFDFIYRSNI